MREKTGVQSAHLLRNRMIKLNPIARALPVHDAVCNAGWLVCGRGRGSETYLLLAGRHQRTSVPKSPLLAKS